MSSPEKLSVFKYYGVNVECMMMINLKAMRIHSTNQRSDKLMCYFDSHTDIVYIALSVVVQLADFLHLTKNVSTHFSLGCQ